MTNKEIIKRYKERAEFYEAEAKWNRQMAHWFKEEFGDNDDPSTSDADDPGGNPKTPPPPPPPPIG